MSGGTDLTSWSDDAPPPTLARQPEQQQLLQLIEAMQRHVSGIEQRLEDERSSRIELERVVLHAQHERRDDIQFRGHAEDHLLELENRQALVVKQVHELQTGLEDQREAVSALVVRLRLCGSCLHADWGAVVRVRTRLSGRRRQRCSSGQ